MPVLKYRDPATQQFVALSIGGSGPPGPPGPQGNPGAQGAIGMRWRGTWDGATAYVPTDGVFWRGRSYIALLPSTGIVPTPNGNAQWDPLALGFRWRGAWSSTATYEAMDAVSSAGSSWTVPIGSLIAPGGAPPESNAAWQLFVSVGAAGPPGATGPPGPQGTPGAGLAPGGLANQILTKNSPTDFDTAWQYQGLPIFASVADRDATWTTPPDGASCITADTGTQWQRQSGVWFTPFRTLARIIAPTTHLAIGNPPGTWSSPTVSLTLPANRRITVFAHYYISTLGEGAAASFVIDGTSQFGSLFSTRVVPASSSVMLGQNSFVTPATGAHTYNVLLMGLRTDGSAVTAFNIEGALDQCFFEIRDAGAA